MPKKICATCAVEFDALGKAKTCSPECSKAAFLKYRREWRRQPKVRATDREYAREYHRRPEVKDADRERDRKRRERPERKEYERERKRRSEHKEYMREYQHRPNRKEYRREYGRKYGQRPEVKEKKREYLRRPEVKEQKRLYDQRADVKASVRASKQKPDYRAKAAERYQRPDVKKKQRDQLRKYRALAKLEALAFARDLLAGKYPDLIPADHDPCLLYTATCRKTGQVLYIGITEDWELRQKQHAASHKGALWLPAAEITIDVYPSRTLAMAAEMVAIKDRGPVFNVVHNDRPGVAA